MVTKLHYSRDVTTGIVYEAKCVAEEHPELFRDQSYVLKAILNYGITASVKNAFEVTCTSFLPETDRIPEEFYDYLPPAAKGMAFDPVQKRMRVCVWVVFEHHSETLEHFLKHMKNIAPPRATTTPWPIVHKYSRDICAALVHLFVNQTIHFDIKLDNIVVSSVCAVPTQPSLLFTQNTHPNAI
ncbi:hypothetical protein Pelo_5124 [Pelomyxa schiedti]|nr:hypothetical protein Pelo_5124 [Pelomyxa schiedti]